MKSPVAVHLVVPRSLRERMWPSLKRLSSWKSCVQWGHQPYGGCHAEGYAGILSKIVFPGLTHLPVGSPCAT